MPDREKLADFGIEDTVDAGDKEVLGAFFGKSTLGNPDEVKDIDDDTDSSTTTQSTTKSVAKPSVKKEEKKEEEEKKPLTEEELANAVLDDEEGTDEEKQKSGDGEGTDSKTTMAALAEELQGLGIFAKEQGEDGKELGIDPSLAPEEFLKMFHKNQTKGINDAIEGFLVQFGDDYREMFDAVFVNGVDPKAYLQTFNKLTDIASMDMTKEADQEKVYKEYFRRQGFPEDKIESKVAKAKVNGDLEEDSTEFHKHLVEQDAKELETMKIEKERKNQEDKRTKQLFLQNVNKILGEKLKDKDFDGIPVTDQIALSARNFLTQEKYKLPTGETLTEFDKFILELKRPENTQTKIKLGLLLMNNLDLSKIKIREKNESVTKAFDWATKGRGVTTGKNKQGQTQVKETEPFI